MKINSRDQQSFYVAIALYESASSNPQCQTLYEECFVLLKAASLEQAREKALTFTKQQEGSYETEDKNMVTWSLKHIVDVAPILYESFEDGTELYARHFRNYEAYLDFEPLLSGEQL